MKKALICVACFVCLFGQEVTHIVKSGDTLWDIAGFYYQNPFLWPNIWRANLDKISDPHWIYPEQVFVIPPAPEMIIAESIPIFPAETLFYAEPQETVYYAPKPRVGEMEVSFIAPEERIFSEELIHRVGYVAEEGIIPAGSILRSEPERERITNFMKVYIDIGEGETKKGDIFTVYRLGPDIKHPKTGQHYGTYIEVLGKLEVEEVASGGARAQVLVSYDIIKAGDLIIPYEKIDIPTNVSLKPTERLLEGYIVWVKTKTPLTENFTVVIIDFGTNSDVTIGDIFRIYEIKTYGGRMLPDLIVGEVQVVSLKPNTSVGLLSWRRLTHRVQAGDMIRLYLEAH